MQLFAVNQVGSLNLQLVSFGRNLADHTFDIVYAVFFHRSAVELVEVLPGSTHINVEDINLGVRIFVPNQHGVLGGVHTADLGAVLLALFLAGGAPGADALHKNNGVRVGAVGGAQKGTAGRPCGVHQALQFQGGDDILRLGVGKFVKFLHRNRVKAGGHHNGTVLFLDKFVLGGIINGASRADLGADTALAGFQHGAVVGVNGRHLRHSLCKGNIDGMAVVHTQIEFVGYLFLGALFGAQSASGADILLDIPCLSFDRHIKIAHKALHIGHFGIGENPDFLILCHIHHFRCQNAGSAVQGREGLVQLGHFAADRGLGFHNIHREAGIGNIQRRLNAGNTSANHKGPFGDRTFTGGKGCVQIHFGHSRFGKDDGLFGAYRHFLMYPGALLPDVGNFHHIGVEPGGRRRFAECGLVHPGRAGADHDAGQFVFLNGLLDHFLSGLRAHILIMGGKDHTGF